MQRDDAPDSTAAMLGFHWKYGSIEDEELYKLRPAIMMSWLYCQDICTLRNYLLNRFTQGLKPEYTISDHETCTTALLCQVHSCFGQPTSSIDLYTEAY